MSLNQAEFKLQVYANRYLNGVIKKGRNVIKVNKPFPDLLHFHVANQRRSESDAFLLKEMGVLAGVFDFICIWPGAPGKGAIEMKSSSGSLSPNQKDFKYKFEKNGGVTAACKSVASVRDTLISWGLTCYNTTAIEPDLRTFEQKRIAAFNFYKP